MSQRNSCKLLYIAFPKKKKNEETIHNLIGEMTQATIFHIEKHSKLVAVIESSISFRERVPGIWLCMEKETWAAHIYFVTAQYNTF